MIQNLTLNEIAIGLAFLVGLYGSIKYIKKVIKEGLEKVVEEGLENILDDKFDAINTKLDEMKASVRTLDVQAAKNFLVRYLADIERGDTIYEAEKQRFWEAYDHYTNDLVENSYIKEWVARLKEEGKLKR